MRALRLNRAEFIFILAVCAAALILLVLRFDFRAQTDKAAAAVSVVSIVSIDGAEYGRYPLAVDIIEVIESSLGVNVLVIKDGTAFIESADCHNQICVKHQPIRRKGDTIICLPHRLIIRLE